VRYVPDYRKFVYMEESWIHAENTTIRRAQHVNFLQFEETGINVNTLPQLSNDFRGLEQLDFVRCNFQNDENVIKISMPETKIGTLYIRSKDIPLKSLL
jgi:hypothetical protein